MELKIDSAKKVAKTFRFIAQSAFLAYPQKVECNICGWQGRNLLSDEWHKHIICPKCRSGIRQRLFFAALQNLENLSFDTVIKGKKILHFAPEEVVSFRICNEAAQYYTADFLRTNCDFKLDISNMPEISHESFDVVIAFDVLEHVPDYLKALDEIYRILTPEGLGIFTVPQKDNLVQTYEDPTIVTPEERTKYFGQWDHLRIFGDDFLQTLESKNFTVSVVNESNFSDDLIEKNVLFPPQISQNPLATNYRKVFFCQKNS